MKNVYEIIIILFVMIISLHGIPANAQKSDCKVTMSAISQTYSGGCRKGLAHGQGIAQGVDHFEGQFKEGLPHGNGVYTWADGSVYKGQWVNGTREGNGKMIIPIEGRDSVLSGYWKKDKYVGDRLIPPYKITRSSGVVRSGIRKNSESGSDLAIKILKAGQPNSDIEGFNMAFDSGTEYQSGSVYGIQNLNFPFRLKIKYRTWNLLHTSQSDVAIEIEINEPGKWELIITN